MITEVSQEALLAFELFQRTPSAKQPRKVLNQHLVEVAMYNNEAIRTIEEIKLSVLKLLNNQLTFSDEECRETLNSCGISGTVEKKGNNTYILTKLTQGKLKKAYESIRQGEKDFDQGLSEYVGRRLDTVIDPFAEALLCKIVKETIQSIFFRNAIKLRKLLEEQSDLASLLESDIDAEKELRGKLTTFISIQSDVTVEATIEGIKRFMANLNDVQRHYIATLHYRVFYFQILNIDPRLQKIQDACCKFLRIYLDTNVLVRYLCDGSSFHEPITDVITMARKLGVRILISSKTLLETERLVNAAKSFSGYLEDSQIGTALLSSPIAINNPIIEAFIVKRRLNPRLKWSGYASRFINLEIFLVTEDIEVNDDGLSNITEDDSYPLVHRAVTDVKSLFASPEVINHDSYNIVLVQNLRNKYPATMLGSSVWLLTIDSNLPRADKRLRRTYPNPHCKTLDQLGGILLPFQNIDKYIATDEYISYLVSQQLGAIFPEEVLDIQFFKEIDNSDVDVDSILKLDPEIALHSLIDLQKDREARTLLSQIQTTSEDEKEPVVKAFYDRALSIISKYKEDEKQQDKREIERLQEGIDKLADELRKLESARVSDQDRITLVRQKLIETQNGLDNYRRMPFWQRIKFLFRR